jgi:ergothioneine biosynthesis protein EgtB
MQLMMNFAQRYAQVRTQALALVEPLSEADAQVQSMPDASPAKWHLAHTTWFFETFLLERFEPNFKPHHPAFRTLFNSYYQGVGDQHPRPQRGLITRPDLAAVKAYRAAVDARMLALLQHDMPEPFVALLVLGLQHEQQHQELLLTDVLHLFSNNPLAPHYLPAWPHVVVAGAVAASPPAWVPFAGGVVELGHSGDGFAFDNETPRHQVLLQPYALAQRLTTQREWADFIADGGYQDPRWWLAAGWDWVRSQGVEAPLYWRRDETGAWHEFTLRGLQPIQPQAPVCHISLFEADAFAQWASAQQGLPLRLPTEAEWEHAAAQGPTSLTNEMSCLPSPALQPLPALQEAPGLQQMFGQVWQWTRSSYLPYPGFRAWAGAVGEYNGKFMVNQTVLRGSSCATPPDHARVSYRNFFPAEARWQFTGLRLARD